MWRLLNAVLLMPVLIKQMNIPLTARDSWIMWVSHYSRTVCIRLWDGTRRTGPTRFTHHIQLFFSFPFLSKSCFHPNFLSAAKCNRNTLSLDGEGCITPVWGVKLIFAICKGCSSHRFVALAWENRYCTCAELLRRQWPSACTSTPPPTNSALIHTDTGTGLKVHLVCSLCLALLLNRGTNHRTIRLSHLLPGVDAHWTKLFPRFGAPVCRDWYGSDVRDFSLSSGECSLYATSASVLTVRITCPTAVPLRFPNSLLQIQKYLFGAITSVPQDKPWRLSLVKMHRETGWASGWGMNVTIIIVLFLRNLFCLYLSLFSTLVVFRVNKTN